MKPHVLVGETESKKNIEKLAALGWGRIWTHRKPRPFPYEAWGFDNGAYECWVHHRPFDEKRFQARLESALNCGSEPYLAVCPDIVAAGTDSLRFSLDWVMRLPHHWPWYLAVQDGMSEDDVRPHLHLFSGLFLGGTDNFKRTAYRWCQLAHSSLKKFHYGRAGTLEKLRHAKRIGADSLDSSFPLWTVGRLQTFVHHWEYKSAQATLAGEQW